MKYSQFSPWHIWSTEGGMTCLLIFSLLFLFVTCALSDFIFGDLVGRIFFSLVIVAGVMTTFSQVWLRYLVISLAPAVLVINWWEHYHPGGSLTIANAVLSLIFMGLLLAVLLIQIFRAGPVTGHRIRGAIVVYLLLGGVWTLCYYTLAMNIPNSFRFPEGAAVGDPKVLHRLLMYFSFSTLTTTGMGDITPATSLTRTLAIFEALAGQLYLVITLARLVSLAILSPKGGAQEKAQD